MELEEIKKLIRFVDENNIVDLKLYLWDGKI